MTASSIRFRLVTEYLATTTIATVIATRTQMVRIVLAKLPGTPGLVAPIESGRWAQLSTVDPSRSAPDVARRTTIRMTSSLDATDDREPTWGLLGNRFDRRRRPFLPWSLWWATVLRAKAAW